MDRSLSHRDPADVDNHPDGEVARPYGLFGLPATILVAADGEIVATRTGEVTADDLDTVTGWLAGADR